MAGPLLSTALTPNENIVLGGQAYPYAPSSSTSGGIGYFADTSGGRIASSTATISSTGAIAGATFAGPRTVLSAATVLTAAQSGALCLWATAAGYLYTLPAPVAGLYFDFLVGATCTSVGDKVITNAGTVFIDGYLLSGIAAATPGAAAGPKLFAGNSTNLISINMYGATSDTTSGGVIGSAFRLTCVSATQWIASGTIIGTGTIVTPFATT